MKKICILLMLLGLILVLAGCGEKQPYKVAKLPDGTVEITAYTGKEEDVVIPSELKGCHVSSIGAGAFENCASVETVTLPEGITSIGEGAFQNCTEMWKVTFPVGMTEIKNRAFMGCGKLRAAYFSEGLAEIGDYAFADCARLERIELPESVRAVGVYAFSGCADVEEVILQDGLVSIGERAFAGPESLYSLCIPQSVESIGENAFGDVPEDWSLSDPAFIVEKGSYAEQYLESAGLQRWGYYAAAGAKFGDREYVYKILDDGTANILRYFGSDNEIVVPAELDGYPVTVIGECAFNRHNSLKEIVLPEGVTTISACAFMGCIKLHTVELPESLQTIGRSAFAGCWDLTGITIPAGVKLVDWWAFERCEDLKKATFLGMDTQVDPSAFWDVPNLTLEVLPGSLAEQYAKGSDMIDYTCIDE